MTVHDPIGATLKNCPDLPMPEGLADRIMLAVEKEMAPKKTNAPLPAWMKYAAAVALVAVGTAAVLTLQQPKATPVIATQNPAIEESIPQAPDGAVESVPEATIAQTPEEIEPTLTQTTPVPLPDNNNAGDTVTVAAQDTMTLSQVVNDIGVDPMADESVADDPMLIMIGF